MNKRTVAIIGMLAAIGLLLAPAATAAPNEVWGKGSLIADGDGIAVLKGRGVIDLSGNGVLWVKAEPGAVIEITGYGHKQVFPDGWEQYIGFNGTAHIVGSRLHVNVAGVSIRLGATGQGTVWLWGHGSYQRGGSNGGWDASGLGNPISYSDN